MEQSPWTKRILGIMLAVLLTAPPWGPRPAVADDEEMTGKVVDYYRRKQNLPPEVNATMKNIRESQIPGARVATIELSRGSQKQDVQILMSADGRYVVFGQVEDITIDPFAEIAKMITTEGQPVRGPETAPVTIVEFSDFQCSYSARAHDTVSNDVLKEYGDKVRLVFKNYPLPFHKWAEPAAVAGECVFDQDAQGFWTLYDYYFKNQREITPENMKDKTMAALKETKVDTATLTKCIDEKKTQARVRADMEEGQQAGVTVTPVFLINGRKISGAQPLGNFKAVIDDELKRAAK